MCKCGFCGTNLTGRSHHQDTQHKKPVWKCSLEKKRKKLTDMYLDDKLTKEAYDDKYSELSKKLYK